MTTSTLMDWIRSLSWSNANVRGTVYAVAATLALIVVLKLLAGSFRKLRERSAALIEGRQTALRIQRWEMVSVGVVQRGVRYLFGFLQLLAVVVLVDIYVTLVLRLFPTTEVLSGRYFEFVTAPVVVLYRGFVAYIPDLLSIVVISVLAFILLRFLRLLFHAIDSGAVGLPGFYTDWAEPTYKLLRVLVLAFVLVAIFPHLPGADEQAFKAVSIFVGALLTLGSTAAVGNAIAGVVLIYTRAFQVGDWVEVGKANGEVVRRTLLVTRIRNTVNEQITIPNAEVLRDHVVNLSPSAKEGRLGLTVSVTIGYDVDWRTVEELLLRAAKATPELSSDPPPTVLQTSLADYGVGYRLLVFTGGPLPLGRIRTALGKNILDEFNRARVEILTPSYSALRRGERSVRPATDIGGTEAGAGVVGEP